MKVAYYAQSLIFGSFRCANRVVGLFVLHVCLFLFFVVVVLFCFCCCFVCLWGFVFFFFFFFLGGGCLFRFLLGVFL